MSTKILRRATFLLLLTVFSANGLFALLNQNSYIQFLQRNFPPDGIISNPSRVIFIIQFSLLGIILTWLAITNETFLRSLSESPVIDKLAYSLIGTLFVIHFSYHFIPKSSILFQVYKEDNFLESLTALCALAASLLLMLASKRIRERPARWVTAVLSLLFFVFGMEEISWGQRIIGWETLDAWEALNSQNETNIHNLFRETAITYPIFNLCIGVSLICSARLRSPKDTRPVYFMTRNASIVYGVIFLVLFGFGLGFSRLSGSGFLFRGELTEEVFSIFGVAYALNRFLASRRVSRLSL